MSFGTAMQRTMPTSTSYSSQTSRQGFSVSAPAHLRSPRSARLSVDCSAYSRQNCGPRYGSGRGFGPMMFGDGAVAAAQVAELMQNFAKSVNADASNTSGFWPVDIEEEDSKYLLVADVPGLEKADLKISINQADQTLKIAGDRKRPQAAEQAEEQTSRSGFRRRYERPMGKFQRTISSLPKDADLSAVSARVDKGVLTISIQKKDLAKDEQDIRIDVA